jgi:hypothetical protein
MEKAPRWEKLHYFPGTLAAAGVFMQQAVNLGTDAVSMYWYNFTGL